MLLRDLFLSKNITQSEVSKELANLKCYKHQQQISEWINGIRTPDAFSIYCLSKVLGVSADEVLEASLKSAGRLWEFKLGWFYL